MTTFQGYSYTAELDRFGGVIIRDTDDGRETYIQPGDDANRLIAELETADAAPEPEGWADGSNDLIANILREFF